MNVRLLLSLVVISLQLKNTLSESTKDTETTGSEITGTGETVDKNWRTPSSAQISHSSLVKTTEKGGKAKDTSLTKVPVSALHTTVISETTVTIPSTTTVTTLTPDPELLNCSLLSVTTIDTTAISISLSGEVNFMETSLIVNEEKTLYLNASNNWSRTITNLKKGSLNEFHIYSVGANGVSSQTACIVIGITYPPGPMNCSEIYRIENISATSFDLRMPQEECHQCSMERLLILENQTLPTKHLLSLDNMTYTFERLTPDTFYTLRVKNFVSFNNNTQNASSREGCIKELWTRPSDPNCSIFQLSTSENKITFKALVEMDITSDITLSMSENANFTRNQELNSNNSETVFTNLTSGRKYNYTIYSLGKGNLKSNLECSNDIYTNPRSPVGCTENFKVITYSTTSISISLPNETSNKDVQKFLIVETSDSNDTYYTIPFPHSSFEIQNLISDTLYTFTLFNIIQVGKEGKVFSTENCTFQQWTRPSLNCNQVNWDSSSSSKGNIVTVTCILPTTSYKYAYFKKTDNTNRIAEIHNVPFTKFNGYTFQLQRGNNYTLSVFLVGTGDVKSEAVCVNQNISIPILPPNCTETSPVVYIDSNRILISPENLQFDGTGAKAYRLQMFPDIDGTKTLYDRVEFSRTNHFSFSNLSPGSKYSFYFRSIGEHGSVSKSCAIEVFTSPEDPDCNKVQYEASIDSFAVYLNSSIVKGAVGYNFKLLSSNHTFNYSSVQEATFDGLAPGSGYHLMVTSVGKGSMMSKNNCQTKLYTRPVNPVCSVPHSMNTSAVTFDFTKPIPNSIQHYRVQLFHGDNQTKQKDVNPFSLLILHNLTPGDLYFITWKSVGQGNKTSFGNCSNSFNTKPSSPKLTFNSTTTTSITVNWTIEGNATSYKIEPHCGCESTCLPTVTGAINKTVKDKEATIAGLRPFSQCNITITAIAGNQQSDSLLTGPFVTEETAPEQIRNMTVLPGSRNVTVTWEEPEHEYGIILYYTAEILQNDNTVNMVNVTKINDYNALRFEYHGLTPGTCYNVSVTASTEAGTSNKTTITFYTTQETPGKVSNLTATNSSSTSLDITWGPPVEPNGLITSYQILILMGETCIEQIVYHCQDCQCPCQDADVGAKDCKAPNGDTKEEDTEILSRVCNSYKNRSYTFGISSFKKTITNLTPFTNYSIHVSAATVKGHGLNSSTFQNTSEDVPDPPQISSTDATVTSIDLHFKRPKITNGIIVQYDVEYIPDNGTEDCFLENNAEYEGIISANREVTILDAKKLGSEMVTQTIDGLHAYWFYTIRVRARTSAGPGNWSSTIHVRTRPSNPGPVRDIQINDVTSDSIQISWTKPCFTNGIISHYRLVSVDPELDNQTINNETTFTFSDLLPFKNYTIKLTAITENGGEGHKGVLTRIIQTLCKAPYPPSHLNVVERSSNTLSIQWIEPKLQTCYTNYTVQAVDMMNGSTYTCATTGFSKTTCEISGLDEYWNYNVTVSSKTVNGTTHSKNSILARTKEAAPGPVLNLHVTSEEDVTKRRALYVKWQAPTERNLNGIIRAYYIRYYVSGHDIDHTIRVNNATFNKAIDNLTGNLFYTVEVFAETVKNSTNKDKSKKENTFLENGAPFLFTSNTGSTQSTLTLIQHASQKVNNDEKQIYVDLDTHVLCDDSNGEIKERGIIVSDTTKISSDKEFRGEKKQYDTMKNKKYTTWREASVQDVMPPYIAISNFEMTCHKARRRKREASKTTVLIGKDGECKSSKGYCNGYLKPGKEYQVRVYLCTNNGCAESEYFGPFKTEPNLVPAIAGSVGGVVGVVVAVAVVIVIVVRRRRKGKSDGGPSRRGEDNSGYDGEPMKNLKKSKTNIPKANFGQHVEQMHADSNLIFSKEYKCFDNFKHLKDTCPSHPTNAAEEQSTRIKNRYTNILAYDHSRVKLLPTDDEDGSDYINANYIPGFTSKREYIATQGPLTCTKDDFWRMIWEQNVSVIVMLTQLVERGRRKCDPYWPEEIGEPVYSGDLIIEKESDSPLNDYTLRVISMKLGDNMKQVKQFQFLAWPDMGIPETTDSMLHFVKEVRDHMSIQSRGPIVVHCSAGVGRTGTFIAVDHLMQHVRENDSLDVFNLVMGMRNNRTNMVQTEDQYIFIHDCIKDYIEKLEQGEDEEHEYANYDNNAVYANI